MSTKRYRYDCLLRVIDGYIRVHTQSSMYCKQTLHKFLPSMVPLRNVPYAMISCFLGKNHNSTELVGRHMNKFLTEKGAQK